MVLWFAIQGATHAGEEIYMFNNFALGQYQFDNNDIMMQNAILDSLTNFAKKRCNLFNLEIK